MNNLIDVNGGRGFGEWSIRYNWINAFLKVKICNGHPPPILAKLVLSLAIGVESVYPTYSNTEII